MLFAVCIVNCLLQQQIECLYFTVVYQFSIIHTHMHTNTVCCKVWLQYCVKLRVQDSRSYEVRRQFLHKTRLHWRRWSHIPWCDERQTDGAQSVRSVARTEVWAYLQEHLTLSKCYIWGPSADSVWQTVGVTAWCLPMGDLSWSCGIVHPRMHSADLALLPTVCEWLMLPSEWRPPCSNGQLCRSASPTDAGLLGRWQWTATRAACRVSRNARR